MKGNIAFLFLSTYLLFWEYVCADPFVKYDSKAQVLRKNKKAGNSRDSLKPMTSGEEPAVHHTSKPPTAADKESVYEQDRQEDDDELLAGNRRRPSKVKLVGDHNKYVERPLAAGDTFTARELLPVTQKLLEKVENPGKGEGIVSSAKSPQDLADKIFQAFFQTSKRIVTLTELDISGLDALQSLAQVGDPATMEKFSRRAAETKVVSINGQLVTARVGKKVSRYNMLHKGSGRRASEEGKPKANTRSKLQKKLGKNRHLLVSKRKNMDDQAKRNSCRWSYECEDPTDLDTCRLKTKCAVRRANVKVDHADYIKSNVDIDPIIVAEFRKSLSIDVLDEEVEKIIERKLIRIRPNNDVSQEIEGLSEYFQKVLAAETNVQKHPPTPIPDEDGSSVDRHENPSNVKKLDSKPSDSEPSAERPSEGKSKAAERSNARRA